MPHSCQKPHWFDQTIWKQDNPCSRDVMNHHVPEVTTSLGFSLIVWSHFLPQICAWIVAGICLTLISSCGSCVPFSMWLNSLSHLVFSGKVLTHCNQLNLKLLFDELNRLLSLSLQGCFFFQLRRHSCNSFLPCLHLFKIQHLIYLPLCSSETVLLIISSRCVKPVLLKQWAYVCITFLHSGLFFERCHKWHQTWLLISSNHQFPKPWSCWSLHTYLSAPLTGRALFFLHTVLLRSRGNISNIKHLPKTSLRSLVSWGKHLAVKVKLLICTACWTCILEALPRTKQSSQRAWDLSQMGFPSVSHNIHLMPPAWAPLLSTFPHQNPLSQCLCLDPSITKIISPWPWQEKSSNSSFYGVVLLSIIPGHY